MFLHMSFNGACVMVTQVVHLAFDKAGQVGALDFPNTRSNAIALAAQAAQSGTSEIHILAVADAAEGHGPVELARVELTRHVGGNWLLQYVSHPAQSLELTREVSAAYEDFTWRARGRVVAGWTPIAQVYSSDELEAQGVLPCARLDLRAWNAYPVVSTGSEVDGLRRAVGLTALEAG
jgi:hypothetical protein